MYHDSNQLDLSHKTIAIVDDDVASIRYFEVLLKTTGASVVSFMNGSELVDYVSKNIESVDMVLLDYLIPLVNGIIIPVNRRRRHSWRAAMSMYSSL